MTDSSNTPDIRWKQRHNNYTKAVARLADAVALTGERELSSLEEQGLIQAFKFTHTPHGAEIVDRAIKPLFLGQNNPTKIIEHGDTWIQKVRRLNQFKLAPETLVFPVKSPADKNSEHYENDKLIINDLREEGVHVIEEMTIELLKSILRTEVVSDTPLFSQSEAG